MKSGRSGQTATEEEWEEPSRKRFKPTPTPTPSSRVETGPSDYGLGEHKRLHEGHLSEDVQDKGLTIASASKLGAQAIAPYLTKHIPDQYAPLGSGKHWTANSLGDSNSKFCYRHRPDMLCRRQADEPTMDKLQQDLEDVPENDRRAISQVWALFSAAPAKHRQTMLQGILAQCCFPQLSFLSANMQKLIKIDFLTVLPAEVAFRILCFLDTASLCKAAQVSRRWRQLADDDVVWHRMCEQHIDRKCTKCGWGLPLLERKLLRATKRQIQLRATSRGVNEWSPAITPIADEAPQPVSVVDESRDTPSSDGRMVAIETRADSTQVDGDYFPKTRPWKEVYKDRFKVGTNWKYGRCSMKIFKGHSNGVMCLQFCDNILATGSYDATIKIWDITTGKELRTLHGHTKGVRCLQFDNTKLISGSLDCTIRVWDWRTGECISTYHGHSEGVIGLHFDANILVSGSVDRTAKVWNFADKSTFTLRGHTDWVNSVRIDTASRTIFTASDDSTVRLWDLDTKKCLGRFEGHRAQVQQVLPLPPDFELEEEEKDTEDAGQLSDVPDSPQSSRASSSGNEPPPRARTAVSHRYDATFNQPRDIHNDQDHYPARPLPPKYMLTASLDSTISLWEVRTGRCIKTYFGHVEGVWTIAADSLRLVSGSEDRTVKVWDPRTGKCERTFTGHAGPVTCIGLSDSRICSGSEDGEVRMYSFKEE